MFKQKKNEPRSESLESEGWNQKVLMQTFVPADLYVSKQADLDDLPEQAQDQVGLPGHEIMGVDAHHHTADRWGGVQSQDQVLLQTNLSVNKLQTVLNVWWNITMVLWKQTNKKNLLS